LHVAPIRRVEHDVASAKDAAAQIVCLRRRRGAVVFFWKNGFSKKKFSAKKAPFFSSDFIRKTLFPVIFAT
jgi:hypothetical protein